ncbi:MAG: phosphatase PAP2 family protein [Acidimicrobiales bacterium]
MPRRGLVVPTALRAPAALWALFLLQTAVIARWPGFFLDTLVDNLIGSLRASVEPQMPGLRGAAGLVARLGAREVLVPLALGAGLMIGWRRRSFAPLALLAGAYLLVAAVASLTKAGLARPQPLPLPGVAGRAFPSGHAAQAVVVLGALAMLAAAHRAPEWRRQAVVGVASVVGAVSVALLWRQAHWLTDMVGGVLLGLACLTTVHAMVTTAIELRSRTPVGRRE